MSEEENTAGEANDAEWENDAAEEYSETAQARAELPDELMLGLSIESGAQLATALADPAVAPDVIGVSPVWTTTTKTDTADALGPGGADRIARAAHARARGIRAVGIGGVGPANVAELAATALDGVCVVSAIMAAADPRAAAADLLARWDRARGADRG